MPFTLSHPAAVLPFLRPLARWGVLSALVVGSIAPDFHYYVGIRGGRPYTHSLVSVFWFSIPVGWIAYLGFQHLLRRPAVFLMPEPLRARLDPRPHIAAFGPVTLSLALGALTHVVWDQLTHRPLMVARAFPFLREEVGTLWGHSIWSYRVLQTGSTLLGGAVLAAAVLLWFLLTAPRPLPSDPPRLRRLRARARVVALLAPPLLGYFVATHSSPPFDDLVSFAWFMAYVAVAGLSTLVVVLGLLGAVLRADGGAAAVR
jgi:hypothetical protein